MIYRWVTTLISWESSQTAQKQMKHENVNQSSQKLQSHQKNTYTCTAESLHAAKRKEKNMNGREIKLEKGRDRDAIHKETEKLK